MINKITQLIEAEIKDHKNIKRYIINNILVFLLWTISFGLNFYYLLSFDLNENMFSFRYFCLYIICITSAVLMLYHFAKIKIAIKSLDKEKYL